MKILRNIHRKKEAVSKINKPSQLSDSTPAKKITPEELNSLIQELLIIDMTEGLMQSVTRELANRTETENQPHKRGSEIGQILAVSVCDSGGNITGDLMILAKNVFIGKGGIEWRLDHCWHGIKDSNGIPCWNGYRSFPGS
jgi:hypothetical protein